MKFLTVKNSAEKAELLIYGDIVDDSWNWGWEDDPNVYPKDIKNMLNGFDGKDVDVHINSGGGHVFAGMAISNMLFQFTHPQGVRQLQQNNKSTRHLQASLCEDSHLAS